MTDMTPAEIAEGERLRDAIRGSTDPQYDQWAFESWIVANGASLLTAARDAARYREALAYYADEARWWKSTDPGDPCLSMSTGGVSITADPRMPDALLDGGKIARAALAGEREG